MDWKTLAQAGAAVVIAALFLRFLKWLIPYMIGRSMAGVVKVVEDFSTALTKHMEHQATEHKAFMEMEKEEIEILRTINGNSKT